MKLLPGPNGLVTIYNDIYELFYNLFLEIGLTINAQGYLTDTDSDITIMFNNKYIKASLNPNPVYTGKTDILFDPAHNYNLMVKMFGYYIDKREALDDPIGYISQGITDTRNEKDEPIHSVFVDTQTMGRVESLYYRNVYLAFIDCIMRLGGTMVDLHNFDIIEDKKK